MRSKIENRDEVVQCVDPYSDFQKLEEANRLELKEFEKKEREAEKLLARIKFLRQLGVPNIRSSSTGTSALQATPTPTSATSNTTISNGHC